MTRHTHTIALFLAGAIAYISSSVLATVLLYFNAPYWVPGLILALAGISCLLFAVKAQNHPGRVMTDVEEVMKR